MLNPLSILRTAARGTRWSQLADYVSPSLFRIMPLGKAIAQVRAFAANSRDTDGAREARAAAQGALKAVTPRVVLSAAEDAQRDTSELPESTRQSLGEAALLIYFAQLMRSDSAMLDLRLPTLEQSTSDSEVHWRPANLYVNWDPQFLAGLRDLYGGFYAEDEARLENGLAALGLERAREPLLKHLGGADPGGMHFSMSAFHDSFHSVFEACRQEDITLHPNFIPLGVFLACLYETLEQLQLAFDVRAAFVEATG